MNYDPYGSQEYKEPESCLPMIHRWRPVDFQVLEEAGWNPNSIMVGKRCYCGLRVLVLHECECGNSHLRQVQVGSVKIGGASGQATQPGA